MERVLLTRAIGRPELGIKLSATSPDDPEYFRARSVVVVSNGLGESDDLPAQQPERRRQSGDPVRLLSVSRLAASKGCFRLVQLVHDLRDRGVDASAELVGDPDGAETIEQLHVLIRKLGLENNVILRGSLACEAKWDAFATADFLVFLTDFEHENVPLVILESMMCGLPVIATRWRGIPGLLADGDLGALVDLSDWGPPFDDVASLPSATRRGPRPARRARDAWERRTRQPRTEWH